MDLLKPLKDDNGVAIVACILILALISLAGIFAMRTSNTESEIVRNDQIYVTDKYVSEAGVISAFENPTTWMTSNVLLMPNTQGIIYDVNIYDATLNTASIAVVTVVARSIVSPAAVISSWDTSMTSVMNTNILTRMTSISNKVAIKSHFKVVTGSGDSASALVHRNFGITVFSEEGVGLIQVGGYKAFPNTGM